MGMLGITLARSLCVGPQLRLYKEKALFWCAFIGLSILAIQGCTPKFYQPSNQSYATESNPGFQLSGPAYITINLCYGPYTIGYYNITNGAPVLSQVPNDASLILTGQGSGQFYQDSNCSIPLATNLVFQQGTSQKTFYFGNDSIPESLFFLTSDLGGTYQQSGMGVLVNSLSIFDHLVVSGLSSTTTAGTSQQVVVTAVDRFGNIVTNYQGTVSFQPNDGSVITSPSSSSAYTFATGDLGTKTFTVTFDKAGNQTFTVTDSASGAQSQIGTIVSPASVTSFAVSTVSSGTAGSSYSLTVTPKDAYNNTVTSYNGTVHFTSSDNQATLPSSYTFVAADNGQHTFSTTFKTAGSQSITATDTTNPSLTGSTSSSGSPSGIAISPAPAASFAISTVSSGTAGSSSSLTVAAKDAYSNTVTSYGGTVHFTSTDSQASLPPNYTYLAADNGQHTFIATFKTSGSQSITATDATNPSLTGSTSSSSSPSGITVGPASVSSFAVSGASSGTAGSSYSLTVTIKDAYNNTITGYTGTVHFTSTDWQAVLPANYTFVAGDSGQHTFSTTLKTSGTQSITATDTVNSSITSTQSGITVRPASVASLAISGASSGTAGSSYSFTVTAKDAYGNTTTGYTGALHFTSTDGQAVLPANYTFVSADNGQHTFSATFKTSGSQLITATDVGNPSLTGSSSSSGSPSGITVSPASASSPIVANYPSPANAGFSNNFTVTAQDAYGNTTTGYTGTVHFTSTDGQAVLPVNYTFVAADAGQHTFSATFKTPGTQSITATDMVTGSITGTQSGITVKAVAGTIFVVSGYPSPTTAGVSHTFTVTAADASGNTVTSYHGTIGFTSSDGQAVLPVNYTFVAGDNGQHTFGATFKTSGTQSVIATDTVTGSITGSESSIAVNPASVASLAVSGYPSPVTAGSSNSFTVTAKDTYNNTVTGYSGTIHFTSTDWQPVLPANSTLTNGTGNFSATLKMSGTQSITATDTVTSSITGAQGSITVNPAAVASLAVYNYNFLSPVTAGTSNSYGVTAVDAYFNIVKSYSGTVHFTSTDSQAVLPANYTFVAGDAGTHLLNATLKTAGTQSIMATDTVTGSITGTDYVTVNPVSVASLAVSGCPSPVTAGSSNGFTVTAKDSNGNTVTGYSGTVHFTSTDGQAVLPANATLTNGTGSFSVTLKTSGTQSITATDTVTSSVTGSESSITVNPASVSSLAVGGTSSETAGSGYSLTVTAKDSYNNTVTGYSGTVHFTSTDGQAVLPANATLTNGTGNFSATLKTSGSQSITATDTVTGSITGTQSSITVNPASVASLAVSGTSSATAGSSYSVTATATDAYNNTVTGYSGTVHFTSTDSQATLPANYTFVTGDAGRHVFSATLKTSGSQSITATDTVTSSITGTSSSITVNAASPSKLVVTGPTSYTVGSCSSAITATSYDAYNNVSNDTSAVTVNLSQNPTGGHFYSDSSCGTSVTSVSIPVSSHSISFYFSTSSYTNVVITASDASGNLSSGTFTLVTMPGVQWLGNYATKEQWATGFNYPAYGYGDGILKFPSNTVLDSSSNLYVMDHARIQRFTASSGAFTGWIGGITGSPTGGDSGCSGAAIATFTPGWCTGGQSSVSFTTTGKGSGFMWGQGGAVIQNNLLINSLGPVMASDGTYFYVANSDTSLDSYQPAVSASGFVSKYLISTGVFQGWIGEIYTAPTGGASGCNGASSGSATPGWCTGGAPGTGTGDGMFSNSLGGLTIDSVHNILYVADIGNNRISKYNASSGAFQGWIGEIATVPTGGATGCNAASVGQATPGWCTGGTSGSGTGDGMMKTPVDVKVDSTNDYLYVADNSNARILRFTASTGAFQGWIGEIATVPTGGATGCTGASVHSFTPGWCTGGKAVVSTANTADGSFGGPQGLALSITNDRLYVTDSTLSVVYKYTASSGSFLGYIGKIGGTKPTGGVSGCTTALAYGATPGWCTGGTIYGFGAVGDGLFTFPSGLSVDDTGNLLYVTDQQNQQIKKFNLSTGAALGWLGGTAQPKTAWSTDLSTYGLSASPAGYAPSSGDATLHAPSYSVVYNGHIYVADTFDYNSASTTTYGRIMKFNESSGTFEGWIGNLASAGGTCPVGTGGGTVGSFNGGWCIGGTVGGMPGFSDGSLRYPSALALSPNRDVFYVVDNLSDQINSYTLSTGAFQGWLGAGCTTGWCTSGLAGAGSGDGMFVSPGGIAFDEENSISYLYVTDGNSRIQKFSVTTGGTSFVGWVGRVKTTPTGGVSGCTSTAVGSATPGWCTGGTSQGGFGDGMFNGGPISVAVDSTHDALYASDGNNRILKYVASTGVFTGWIGAIATSPTGGASGCAGAAASSFTPGWCTGGTASLANVYTATTNGGFNFSTSWIYGLGSQVTYSNGYLYVADSGNSLIKKFNASTGAYIGWMGRIGQTTNLLSKSPSPTGGASGCSGAAADTITPGWCIGGYPSFLQNVFGAFLFPTSVGVDVSSGMIYVTDTYNRISQFSDK